MLGGIKIRMGKRYIAQRRKGAKNKKFEARNPKAAPRIETNPNAQKSENPKPGASD
jgi:hypothetical protein